MWYGIGGVISTVNGVLVITFSYIKSGLLGCSFYFFLTKSIMSLFVLTVFIILAKRYKLRVRENEIYGYTVVHEHFTRYLEEEDRLSLTFERLRH